MSITQKYNLPSQFGDEAKEYRELFEKGTNRTTTGTTPFISATSSTTYNTTTGDAGIYSQLQAVLADYNIDATWSDEVGDSIGDLTTLTTTEKSNLVGAINELDSPLEQYEADESETIDTTSTSIQDKLVLTVATTGTYIIYFSADCGNANQGITSGSQFICSVNDSDIISNIRNYLSSVDTDNYLIPFGGIAKRSLTANDEVKVQYLQTTASVGTRIRNARIYIKEYKGS